MANTGRDFALAPHVVRQWVAPSLRVSETVYPPLRRMAPHVDGRARVSLLVAGAVEEDAADGPRLAGPGSVVVKPADAVHANRFGPAGARIVTLEPDAALLEEFAGPASGFSAYRWRHGASAALTQVVVRAVHSGCDRQAAAVRGCLAGLMAFVGAGGAGGAQPPRWLDAARRTLHEHAAGPPAVSVLAGAARVHPVYFARAFRRWYHCSVGEYVRRVRVLNAAEMLAHGERPLAHIALETGFVDQAHFGHAFRRETGTTPGAYRRRQVANLQDPIPCLG